MTENIALDANVHYVCCYHRAVLSAQLGTLLTNGPSGTRCAGKTAVQEYLAAKDFERVAIRPDLEQLSDTSSDVISTFDDLYEDPVAVKHLSFLSMGPAPSVPPAISNRHKTRYFTSPALMLDFVTREWRRDWVTVDLTTRDTLEMFMLRPFVLVLSIDAPLFDRFNRFNSSNSPPATLEEFVNEDDYRVFGAGPQESTSSLHGIRDLVDIHVSNPFKKLSELHQYLDDLNLLDPGHLRPNWDAYFMTLASLASRRSNCMKRRVGAVLVRENRILATGYNGTPRGLTNCNEGGCIRCNMTAYPGDVEYECVCLHAEENALLEAGRERVGMGSVLYCNTCPCLTCTIKIIQAGVKTVVYNLSYKVDDASARLMAEAGVELRRFQPVNNPKPFTKTSSPPARRRRWSAWSLFITAIDLPDCRPRILLIDSYDSFTFNLASLCKQAVSGCSIHIIRNDQLTIEQVAPSLVYFDAVIISPGPGSPENDNDVGIIKHLWNFDIPIFGVCLGLQSLGLAFGARVARLPTVKHGQISTIHHAGRDIFEGVEAVDAVRYHSLHIVLSPQATQIEEIAFADDKEDNGHVVMAIRHVSKPFWAVQYHPESVRTRGGGLKVIQNFWRLAQSWNIKNGRNILTWTPNMTVLFGNSWPSLRSSSDPRVVPEHRPLATVDSLNLPDLTSTAVCELFGVEDREDAPFVLLDSAAHPGRYSIMGCLMQTSPQILYYVPDEHVTVIRGQQSERHELEGVDIWSWLAKFMAKRRFRGLHPDSPFSGGLVGILSYELGVHQLNVPIRQHTTPGDRYPDVNMVFVERSIVMDSETGQVYVQSIIEEDLWVADTIQTLRNFSPSYKSAPSVPSATAAALPSEQAYIARIDAAMEHLSAGDSYELCLTARTTVRVPKDRNGSSSWRRYKALRSKNPAPYSAYLRLHPTTFLSSSPERFMLISQPPNPMVAEELLAGSVKEVAENLMIVDLIRHDLHSVVGEDVQVRQFCTVEEYETVWQLVSVIEGKLEHGLPEAEDPDSQIGWEILKTSLPPGSMTGAPKKRSVEILQNLEDTQRNLYSGVFGYWCVGGSMDWSVAIRSCFKLSRPEDSSEEEEWHIGAGGAITALSEQEAEWDEMKAKLQSTIAAFYE
ncbi:hypothetical protein MIND_00498600 [Mycena indigotica]|uniref:Deoxycytidylate deaminase n=1 Tax=Mycena indigotica TaxID=2126181 RepID=A0A8H6SVN9_9AGAR|nr:uncharacterized protein MIND_00498600 [Mycena indigotica]KAF7307055.1 hypothetical protein MIND_00498600 [Mycena indigotica]